MNAIRTLGTAAFVAATLASLALPKSAAAGEFAINACQADRANFSTQAFEDFATRGMMWKRACNPEGPGLRGLVTANVVRRGRVGQGARSYFILRAPEGTRFGHLLWSGMARRRDCRYALQLWADRPDGPPVPIKNVRANRGCPHHGRAQAAGWPSPHDYDIGGTTRIVQRTVCLGSSTTPYCAANGLNYIRTFTARATVIDVSPPAVSIVPDNAFTRGEWVNGVQSVTYGALDNVGVKVARAMVGTIPVGIRPHACDYSRRVPCTNGQGNIDTNTHNLPEGTHSLHVEAEDGAGNLGASSPVTVRVDHVAPGAVPVAVSGGDTWRTQNDFAVSWTNPNEDDRAPITGAHFRICRPDGSACQIGGQSALGIARVDHLAVPDTGVWQLRLWREDAAGNTEPANASVPVSLRFDPDPPRLGFEKPSPTDPTRVSVVAGDDVSGVATGQIEVSRQGSFTWQSLPTEHQGERLVARIDDAHLPPGTYLLRAAARDQAGNESSTTLRLDGQPAVLTLPLRIRTSVRAGVIKKQRTKRRKSGRPRVVFEPRIRAHYGRRIKIAGTVHQQGGRPVPGAQVRVYSRSAIAAEQLIGVAQADTGGAYSYVTRASSSQTLRFVYDGTALLLPSEADVELAVPAASSIHARPRRVINGGVVRFAGRVRSLPQPPAGKLVELQVALSGHWQTFRTVRTTPDARWNVRYRFRRSCGDLRYRFRARLPVETGYPFAAGRTGGVEVRVRGAPCR